MIKFFTIKSLSHFFTDQYDIQCLKFVRLTKNHHARYMKHLLLLSIIFIFFLFTALTPVKANTEFDSYLSDFYQKQERASQILKEIETDLKDGSRDKACARQREAAIYGIEATESLIKAFEVNGSKNQMENLKAGLDKWRELRDYC